MNAKDRIAAQRDVLLQTFAAELASAAYSVALRHGPAGAWVDLELDLWRTLIEAVRQWDRGERRRRHPEDEPSHLCAPVVVIDDGSYLAREG